MDRLNGFVKHGQPLSVNLRNNPLSCDCRSIEFVEWMRSTGVKLDQVENYMCRDGFPKENIGMLINQVRIPFKDFYNQETDFDWLLFQVQKMECENELVVHGYSSGTVTFLSFIIVIMILIVIVLVVYHKQRISKLIQPLVDDITRQMGYKGLANEEQQPQEAHV